MLSSASLIRHADRIRKCRRRMLAACSRVQSTSNTSSGNWLCSRSITHGSNNGSKPLKISYATSLFDNDDLERRDRAGRKSVGAEKRLIDERGMQLEQKDSSNRRIRQNDRFGSLSTRAEEFQLQSVGLSLDQQIAYFETLVAKNGRIKAEVFDERIVEKIVRGNAGYLSYLRQNPIAAVVLVSWCGEVLSSVTIEIRMEILDRLWNALRDHGLVNTAVFNARLSVWLENDVTFEPKEVLKEMRSMSLSPDVMTYKCLMAQFCMMGDEEGVLKVLDFVKAEGLEVADTLNYGLVYLYTLNGDDDKVKALLQTIESKYDEEGLSIALGAMLRAATSTGKIEKITAVLNESIERDVLIDDDSVLKAVRNLAKSGEELQLVEICKKMLERAQLAHGYFSKCVSTMNQLTLVNKYFLFVEVLRSTSRQFANFIEPVQVIMHHMAAKNTSKDVFIRVVDEIESTLQLDDSSILDFGVMACATHEDYTRAADLTFLVVTLCDRLDAGRQRPHLFFPLFFNKFKEMASIDQLIDNARAFFKMGYKLDDPLYLNYFALQVVAYAFEKMGAAQATEKLREFVPRDAWQRIISYLSQKNVIVRSKRIAEMHHSNEGEDPLLSHLKESAEAELWHNGTVRQARTPSKKKNRSQTLPKNDIDESLPFEPEPSSWDSEEEVVTRARRDLTPKLKKEKSNRFVSAKDRLHQLDDNLSYMPEPSSWDIEEENVKKRAGGFKSRARRTAGDDLLYMPEPTLEEEEELYRQSITPADPHSSGAVFINAILQSKSGKKRSNDKEEAFSGDETFPGLRRPDGVEESC